MSSRTRWLSAALATCLVTAPALAQHSPLAMVPAKSPIVVQVRGWERTLERVKVAVKAAAPDYAPMIVNQFEAGLNQALMGRELKGLAKEGPIFLVFTEMPTGEQEIPEMALVVRVANYVQFRDGFLKEEEKKELKVRSGYETTQVDGKDVYFLSKGDYAVMSSSEKSVKLFQDKKAESLAGKLDKSLETKLLESDVSAYVDMKAINKEFGDDIATAKGFLDQAFQQAEGQGIIDKAQIEIAKKMFDGIFQLVEEAERVVLGLSAEPDGFSLKLHTQVGAKSKTNELLKVLKPAETDLGKLPGGAMMYIGGTVGQEWVKMAGGVLTAGNVAGGVEEDKAVTDAAKELKDLPVDEWAMAADIPNAGVQVFRYRDPTKAVETNLKLFRAIPKDSAYGGVAIKGKPEVKAKAQKVNGFVFHGVTYTVDIDRTVEKLPEEAREPTRQILKKTAGTEQRTWFGTEGKTFVQVTAKDWPAASKMLETYFGGKGALAAATGYTATRKQLPAKANLIALIDAGRYVYVVGDAIGELLKDFTGSDVKLNRPEGPPSYIGFAVGLEDRNVTFDLWVPAAGVKAILKVLAPLLGGLDG